MRSGLGEIARTALFVVLASAGGADAARSQEGAQEARAAATGASGQVDLVAHRLPDGEGVDLDGFLNDAAWQDAIPITDFTQQEPVEGGVPSAQTEIRVVYTEHALYIGAKLHDDPDGILAFQKRRDAFLSTDDRFMWILDTFGDGRTGYFFETNAAGLLGDALITGGNGGGGRAWDGIWDVKTQILEDGWSLEIEIPFRSLNFDPEADYWGINFQRTIRRKNEEILWRGFRRNQELRRPVHAGRLTGLTGLSQGLGLELTPYVVTNWKNEPGSINPTTYPSDIGIDVNYNLTPSVKAGVSVNTDFAEAEVDDRRINLTRFPTRFEERRDFFIEGSGVFSFASRNGVEPYFSRRIGLLSGEQIPIDYAARLGGQAGRYEMGVIHVATGGLESVGAESGFFPGEQFTAARIKRTLFEQSSVGAIYTRRATSDDPNAVGPTPLDRHTAGVDADFFTSQLFGDKNFQVEAFFVWNSNPDRDVDQSTESLSARGFRVNYPNDLWFGHLSYRELGDAYQPAMGFVNRNGFRRIEPQIGWSPRPDIDWIRQLRISTQFRYLEDINTGVVEEREWEFDLLNVELESQDEFDISVVRVFEFLENDFEIEDGVFILQGGYTTWEVGLGVETANRRRVSGNLDFSRGGFWDGNRTELEGGVEFRPNPGVELEAAFEHNAVDLPTASFSANLFRLGAGWDISPWASVISNVQYDNDSQVLGLFSRLRWIVQPGNEFFLVFTHNWQNLGEGLLSRTRELSVLSRGLSVKLNYTLRL